jgi:hypothetical protein
MTTDYQTTENRYELIYFYDDDCWLPQPRGHLTFDLWSGEIFATKSPPTEITVTFSDTSTASMPLEVIEVDDVWL